MSSGYRRNEALVRGVEQKMLDTSDKKHLSFWIDTTPRTDYPVMPSDTSVDVAVLGGGITGLTAAVLLKRLGKTVALIEARRRAEGVT